MCHGHISLMRCSQTGTYNVTSRVINVMSDLCPASSYMEEGYNLTYIFQSKVFDMYVAHVSLSHQASSGHTKTKKVQGHFSFRTVNDT